MTLCSHADSDVGVEDSKHGDFRVHHLTSPIKHEASMRGQTASPNAWALPLRRVWCMALELSEETGDALPQIMSKGYGGGSGRHGASRETEITAVSK